MRVNGNAIELGRTNIAAPLFRVQNNVDALIGAGGIGEVYARDTRRRSLARGDS